jgi:hypothetical protein
MGIVGKRGGRKKKENSFNPNREFISDAVEKFLKKGGTIKKMEAKGGDLKQFVSLPDDDSSIDFLFNEGRWG